MRALNRLYRSEPALWSEDFTPDGFRWLEPNDAAANVIAFVRASSERVLVCVANNSPVVRESYRIGLPSGGRWREVLNTDSRHYGGSDVDNGGWLLADELPWNEQAHSVALTLPPLAVLWLVPEAQGPAGRPAGAIGAAPADAQA